MCVCDVERPLPLRTESIIAETAVIASISNVLPNLRRSHILEFMSLLGLMMDVTLNSRARATKSLTDHPHTHIKPEVHLQSNLGAPG